MSVGEKFVRTNSPSVPHPYDLAVGRRLRFARKVRRLSQGALARAVGVSFQQVQKYERGANRVSASMLRSLQSSLRCRSTISSPT